MDAVSFLATLAREAPAKVADYWVARECGVQPRTVSAWRKGERRVPARVHADLLRMKAERARRLIAMGKREMAEVIAEQAS